MKKIQVIIKDKNTLILQEDAKIGDVIDLNSILSIDQTHINNLIEKEKESSYQKQINEQMLLKIDAINKEHQLKLLDQTNFYTNEINKINAKLKELEINKNIVIENTIKGKNAEITLIKSQNEVEINKLRAIIN